MSTSWKINVNVNSKVNGKVNVNKLECQIQGATRRSDKKQQNTGVSNQFELKLRHLPIIPTQYVHDT